MAIWRRISPQVSGVPLWSKIPVGEQDGAQISRATSGLQESSSSRWRGWRAAVDQEKTLSGS
jgi:hypothetical protein